MTVLFIITTLLTLLENTQNHQVSQWASSQKQSGDITWLSGRGRWAQYEFTSQLIISLCLFYLSDHLAHILNHHLICCDGLHGKKAPLMDVTPAETNPLLSELKYENMKSLMTKIDIYVTP